MQIITVKKPAAGKNPIPEYDPADVDLSVNLVNMNTRKREERGRRMESRKRIEYIKQREASVARRERSILRREEQFRAMNHLTNVIVNTSLIGFTILGVITAFWLCITL